MRKLLLSIPALLLFVFTNAQTVTYSVDNYTQKLSPFKPSITLLGLESIVPQFGLTIEGAVGKRLGYNTVYRRNYLKNLFTPNDNLANPDAKETGNYFEAGLDLFLTDRVKKGSSELRVVTSSATYGNYTYTRSFRAYVDKRTQFGLHGGIYYFNRSLFTGTTEDPVLELTDTKTGTKAPTTTNYTINSNNPALFAGLVFKKVRKATIHSGGWKYYRHMARRIYMDVLLGQTSYKNVTINTTTYEVKAIQSSPVGYRLGFEWDQMGVVTGLELGYRPGVNLTAMPGFNYFQLNFSFNLLNGDKQYAMRNK